jgi:hypothetical protein
MDLALGRMLQNVWSFRGYEIGGQRRQQLCSFPISNEEDRGGNKSRVVSPSSGFSGVEVS